MASNDKSESRRRGFASMDQERQRQISSQGGKAAHQKGTAHEFDSAEAREAGRKGGLASGGRRRGREPDNNHPRRTEQDQRAEERAGGEELVAWPGHGT